MNETERRAAEWARASWRAVFSDADRKKLAAQGHALPDGSFPIRPGNKTDLLNAIKAAPLGGAPTKQIHEHIAKHWAAEGHPKLPVMPAWLTAGKSKPHDSVHPPEGVTTTSSKPRRGPRHRAVRSGAIEVVSYGIEQRATSSQFTVSDDGKDTAYIDGCAIRYSPTVSQIRDSEGKFAEEVMPGALKGADTSDVRFLVNHAGVPMARWCPDKKIDTLQLDDRKDGLYFRAAVDLRSQAANDICVALDNKSIDQCSYGFTMEGGKQQWTRDFGHRTIQRYGSIVDCSVVTYPAEPSTSAAVDHTNVARTLAIADSEMRSGKTISKATATRLIAAHQHLAAAGQSTSAAGAHIADLLTANGMSSGLMDGTDGAGPKAAPGWGSAPGTFGDGTGSRSLHQLLDDDSLGTEEALLLYSEARQACERFARIDAVMRIRRGPT